MIYSNYLDSKKCCIKKTLEKGPQGPQGEQGAFGHQGATGTQSATGQSTINYGVTGNGGYTGAFTPQWINSAFTYPSGNTAYSIGCDPSNNLIAATYLPGGDWYTG